MVVVEEEVYDKSFGKHWWVFLITGTLWLILSLVMFRFDITSARAIGILAGIVFIFAGVIELGVTFVVRSGWWKALNALLSFLLIVGGIMSFIHPENAFEAIASITGFMFLFVGIMDILVALTNRTGVWWLRLVVGLVCVGLAYWASGDFDRKAVLLVAWVAAFALLRGITHLIIAFSLRSVHRQLSAR